MRTELSTLLAAIPKVQRHGRQLRQSTRLVGVAVAIGIALFYMAAMWWRWLPLPSAYPFYWFHDEILLPMRGYGFTRFFPAAIGWWGALFTFTVLWLIFYVLDRSLVRRPHIRLTRAALNIPIAHRWLLASAKGLRYIGIHPELWIAVVEHERTMAREALEQAIMSNAPTQTAAQQLALFTETVIRAYLAFPTATRTPYSAFQRWQESAIWLWLARSTISLPGLELCLPAVGQEWREAGRRLENAPPDLSPSFALATLIWETVALTSRYPTLHPQVRHEEHSGGERTELALCVQLTEARRRWLESYSRQMHLGVRGAGWVVPPHQRTLDPLATLRDGQLAKAGELSVGVALLLNLALQDAQIAHPEAPVLALFEALEIVRLAVKVGGKAQEGKVVVAPRLVEALVAQVPASWAFVVPAYFTTRAIEAQVQEWTRQRAQAEQNNPIPDPLLAEADFTWVREQGATLHRAAGQQAKEVG